MDKVKAKRIFYLKGENGERERWEEVSHLEWKYLPEQERKVLMPSGSEDHKPVWVRREG